jgi:PKD domain
VNAVSISDCRRKRCGRFSKRPSSKGFKSSWPLPEIVSGLARSLAIAAAIGILASVAVATGSGFSQSHATVQFRPSVNERVNPNPPQVFSAVTDSAARVASSSGPYEGVAAYTNQIGTFDGVSTTIDVTTPTIPSPGYGYYSWDSFGIFTLTTGSDIIEFGFIEIRGDTSTWGPYPFYLNTTDYIQADCGPGALTAGPHVFSASVVTGTDEWEFTVDGSAMAGTSFGWGSIASCNGPAVTGELQLNSSSAYEDAMANYAWEDDDNPSQGLWAMPSVTFPVAFSVHSNGSWQSVPVGLGTGYNSSGAAPSYGVEGEHQDSALSSDEFVVGSVITWPGTNAVLWAPPLQVTASISAHVGDVPLTVTFSASASGGTGTYDSYDWAFGDTTTGQGPSLDHTYSAAGTYSATVEITDSSEEQTTSSPVLVTVSSDPTVATPIATPASVDVGQSVTFTTTGSGGSGGLTYNWSGLPAGCGGTSAMVTCNPTSAVANAAITVTVQDSSGFSVTSGALTFTVYPAVSVVVTTSHSSVLQGSVVTFSATVTGGSGDFQYTWSGLPGGCSAPSGAALTCSPTASGTFLVTVTVKDSNEASSSGNATLTVNPSFVGLPAEDGYAIVGGSAAAILIVAVVASLLLLRRRKARRPPQQPSSQTPPVSQPPNPPAP